MYLTLHLKLTQPGSMLAFPGAPFQGGTRDKAPSVHSLPMETGPRGWGSELEEAESISLIQKLNFPQFLLGSCVVKAVANTLAAVSLILQTVYLTPV